MSTQEVVEPATEKELSYSGWLRNLILNNHDLSLEELCEKHIADKWENALPEDKQNIYLAKSKLCQRWGVNTVNDLPVNKNNSANLSGLIRLYLKKYGFDSTFEKADKFFRQDGLIISSSLFRVAKLDYKKQLPDENSFSGPRAGKSKKVRAEKSFDQKYVQMISDTKSFVQKVGGIGPARILISILETALK